MSLCIVALGCMCVCAYIYYGCMALLLYIYIYIHPSALIKDTVKPVYIRRQLVDDIVMALGGVALC